MKYCDGDATFDKNPEIVTMALKDMRITEADDIAKYQYDTRVAITRRIDKMRSEKKERLERNVNQTVKGEHRQYSCFAGEFDIDSGTNDVLDTVKIGRNYMKELEGE